MSAVPETPGRGRHSVDTVGGLLSSAAIFVGLLALAYRPVRLGVAAIVLALVATAIGGRHQRLAAIAVGVSGTCWFLGMMTAILSDNPLF